MMKDESFGHDKAATFLFCTVFPMFVEYTSILSLFIDIENCLYYISTGLLLLDCVSLKLDKYWSGASSFQTAISGEWLSHLEKWYEPFGCEKSI